MSTEKKDKFSIPGIARSIVRPVVRTTDAVVKRGETFTKGAVRTVKHTLSGTVRVASGLVSDTSKTVKQTVVGRAKPKRKTKKSKAQK
jgi:hypothetical protein